MFKSAKSYLILLTTVFSLPIFFQIAHGQTTAKEFLELGETQLEQKNYDGALKTFSDCIRLYPAKSVCYYGRGNAYRFKWKLDAAIADYTRFIKDAPTLMDGYFARAVAYKNKRDYPSATVDLEAALKINPDNADVKRYLELLKGMVERGKRIEASEVIFANTELGMKYAEQHFNRGIQALNKQEYGDAIYAFSRCLVLSPKVASCYAMRSLAYYYMEEYEPSLSDINQALQLNPQNADIYNNRALIYIKTNKKAQAAADAKKALELAPANEQAKNILKELGVQ